MKRSVNHLGRVPGGGIVPFSTPHLFLIRYFQNIQHPEMVFV